jgi:hypothetical protein
VKKVLIISYFYPPKPAVGSLRPFGLAKYLPQFDWEPIVVTDTSTPRASVVHKLFKIDPNQNLLAQASQLKSKLFNFPLEPLLKLYSEFAYYPDGAKWWTPIALDKCVDVLLSNDVSAIISTSSPVTCHVVASYLRGLTGLPWIADLRDGWTTNHYYPYSRFRKTRERAYELEILKKADVLTTTSEPLALDLIGLHDKRTKVIINGYDPQELNPGVPLTDIPTITYTGNIYPGKQSPEEFFSGNPKGEIRFYGPKQKWVDDLALKYGLTNVKQYGVVSRDEALLRQWNSHSLLYLCWDGDEGIYSQKLFEYVAAKRPIITSGKPCKYVQEVLDDIRKGNTEKYSQVRMAQEFAQVLDSIREVQ